MVKILGIDPGLERTGWAVLKVNGNHLCYQGHGIIKTQVAQPITERLGLIFEGLKSAISQHQPDEIALEETFVNMNAASSLKLGYARGVIMLLPGLYGLPLHEYSANKIKKAVVGSGHADKSQIMRMVEILIKLPEIPKTFDIYDAFAVAICHSNSRRALSLGRIIIN